MRGVFDGPVPVSTEPGINLEGAGTVVRESGWATASKLTGSLTSRLRAAGKASGAKLRGAGAGLDTADALEREAGAGGETRKKRKLHPMPGFNASGTRRGSCPVWPMERGTRGRWWRRRRAARCGGGGGAARSGGTGAPRRGRSERRQRATARRRRSLRPATRAAAARSRRCAGKCMSAGRRSSCSAPLWSAANSAGSRRVLARAEAIILDLSVFEYSAKDIFTSATRPRAARGARARATRAAPNPAATLPAPMLVPLKEGEGGPLAVRRLRAAGTPVRIAVYSSKLVSILAGWFCASGFGPHIATNAPIRCRCGRRYDMGSTCSSRRSARTTRARRAQYTAADFASR